MATAKLHTVNENCWPTEVASYSFDYRRLIEGCRSLAYSTGWRRRQGLFGYPSLGRDLLTKPFQLVSSVLAEALDLFAFISFFISGHMGH